MELRPFVAHRDYHSLARASADAPQAPFIEIPGATFHASPDWWYRFEYAIEIERGLDSQEDLFTPGVYRVSGTRIAVIVSTNDPRGRDAFALLERERVRREAIGDTFARAADQFIVRRGRDRRTIVAGYHWFTDWGRDTMISLPGLCLVTKRFDDARAILLAFAESVSEGMLPNRFPDSGEAPEYNTVDATLWFFVAVQKFLDGSGDENFVRERMLPVLRDIVAWHEHGTRHDIHVDGDGLLVAGERGVQLTWMDAKVGGWVVTPREGKAVEINALWFNALMILSRLANDPQLAARAARVRERFRDVFWNEERGCLFDVVNGSERDASVRPNQIFALSLPQPLLDRDDALRVLAVIDAHLLTPFGLRTLSPDDPRFKPRLIGPPHQRDAAYHNGTVWPWLIGPYANAVRRFRGVDTTPLLEELKRHFDERGSVAECFDGAAPHAPRGCVAQAWSVAELMRAIAET